MKTCNCLLKLDESHTILKTNVTPAEMLILVALHQQNAKGDPIQPIPLKGKKNETEVYQNVQEIQLKDEQGNVVQTVEVSTPKLDKDGKPVVDAKGEPILEKKQMPATRSDEDEKDRLTIKYGSKVVEQAFPGAMPQLPTEFDQARQLGLKTQFKQPKLTG